jgi:hypothetical protein
MKADEGKDQPGASEEARAVERALKRGAERLAEDARFLGHTLKVYRERYGISEEQLAGVLRCQVGVISRLAVCFVPRAEALIGGEPGRFRQDVEAIAAAGPCDAVVLAQVVKEVWALAAMGGGTAGPGWLMAARDRREKDGGVGAGEGGGP